MQKSPSDAAVGATTDAAAVGLPFAGPVLPCFGNRHFHPPRRARGSACSTTTYRIFATKLGHFGYNERMNRSERTIRTVKSTIAARPAGLRRNASQFRAEQAGRVADGVASHRELRRRLEAVTTGDVPSGTSRDISGSFGTLVQQQGTEICLPKTRSFTNMKHFGSWKGVFVGFGPRRSKMSLRMSQVVAGHGNGR